ncbi:hypothetical protein CEXT_685001 [Caerostris extrusa]|uniref:Uncharacterized protein n=1 Tax=Caerostris extrusa TaxID=172846 RepID=A0AAV4V0G6_CAEEX|nr:hypothetical protein CEXT_685001 [Caerostris extrusa]
MGSELFVHEGVAPLMLGGRSPGMSALATLPVEHPIGCERTLSRIGDVLVDDFHHPHPPSHNPGSLLSSCPPQKRSSHKRTPTCWVDSAIRSSPG